MDAKRQPFSTTLVLLATEAMECEVIVIRLLKTLSLSALARAGVCLHSTNHIVTPAS